MADVLRRELYSSGIRVSLIEPGSIKTPIWDKAVDASDVLQAAAPQAEAIYGSSLALLRVLPKQAERFAASPRLVARAVRHALTARRPKLRYLVGPEALLTVLFFGLTPTRLVDFLVAHTMRLLARRFAPKGNPV
jgi:NAD(P)-dependent dehydrogenase (short-subunit alcohol dehydrogenase family)